MKRITPESAARLVAIYAARAGLTGRQAPAVNWTFTVDVVPGLSHPGEDGKPAPAWAVVEPKVNPGGGPYPGGTARVRIRDIDATPIPGFDGDPMFEIRVTVAHEMLHAVVAEAIAAEGGSLTVPAEEQIVEAAAQAIVRSEGTTDARVMARAVGAIPSTLRARIAASAGRQARGATMDPNLLKEALDAIEAGDAAKAIEILKGLIVAAASGGAAPPTEPDGDELEAPVEAREEPMDNDPNKPKPGAPPAARPVARVEDPNARRARMAVDSLNRSAIRARLHETRVVDGVTLSPELEKLILAETDIDAAEKLLKVAALSRGDGSPVRARSGEQPRGAKPPEGGEKKPKYNEADLIKEGFHPAMARDIATETDDKIADVAVAAARARIATSSSPWAKPNGGAS